MRPRRSGVLAALVLVAALTAVPGRAEKNLKRPPGTTRYAAMVERLNALLRYDHAQGAGRMSLTSLGTSVKGRALWMVTLRDPANSSQAPGSREQPSPLPGEGEGGPQGRVRGVTGEGDAKQSDEESEPGAGTPKRLFYLCRQHGHEPASTEGALAFIERLVRAAPGTPLAGCLQRVTVYIVPMANPDGAEAFLRHNAHDVDLNRDWLKRTQPETRALYQAILRLRPDLMTDQHELYPNDTRGDFTETAGPGSGASDGVIAACDAAQDLVHLAMRSSGYPVTEHWIDDHHPARLAHRYGCVVVGVPTILFETNRLESRHRTVAARADAHAQFMTIVLRDLAGEREQLLAEAAAWQSAHDRNAQLLASRKKPYRRQAGPTAAGPGEGREARPSRPEAGAAD